MFGIDVVTRLTGSKRWLVAKAAKETLAKLGLATPIGTEPGSVSPHSDGPHAKVKSSLPPKPPRWVVEKLRPINEFIRQKEGKCTLADIMGFVNRDGLRVNSETILRNYFRSAILYGHHIED